MVPTGVPIWYSFGFYFPRNFEILNNRLVFAQWKQSTEKPESPFLSLRYINGKLFAQVVFGSERERYFAQKKDWRGKWHKVVVYYKLLESGIGEAKTWVDKELVINYSGRLGSMHATSDPHFKMGLYRDQIEVAQTIYLANFKRATRKELL